MSSAHRGLALALCVVFAFETAGTAGWAAAANAPENCLLLKLSSPSVPEEQARERMAPMPGLLLRELNVRWVPLPAPPASQKTADVFPDADDASLERISKALAAAIRGMDAMDTREAGKLLSDAEGEARKFRLDAGTRPLIAEIFLRRGVLALWEGDRASAEDLFARSRALRPGFSPDPALFSPAFRDAWTRSENRTAGEAEILVQSLPPGAAVSVDGKTRGTTPCRIRVGSSVPVRLRVSLPGYQDAEKTAQWLPGDSESLEWVLVRDRVATMGELLASAPDGKGSGKLLGEMANGAGASRTALIVLTDKGGTAVARVLSFTGEGRDPALLGEFEWPSGENGNAEAAAKAGKLLRDAGWPAAEGIGKDPESPWYHKWWVWAFLGVLAIGLAAGGGGGGGGSGSSSGSIGVSF